MSTILIFILGAITGGAAVWIATSLIRANRGIDADATREKGKEKESLTPSESKPLTGLVEKQTREKEENKKRILGVLETQTPLTNNRIEELLGISDATATRYLDELEEEGRIRQVGKTGKHVYYEKR